MKTFKKTKTKIEQNKIKQNRKRIEYKRMYLLNIVERELTNHI